MDCSETFEQVTLEKLFAPSELQEPQYYRRLD